MQDTIASLIRESIAVKEAVIQTMTDEIAQAARMVASTLQNGGLVAFCGNGGSAADCQHLAGELVGRFKRERPAWRGIALTTDTSILTAIGNDYGYDQVFARQVEALLGAGGLLIALSTSGNAQNCLLAVDKAHQMGARTMALTGATGGQLKRVVDLCLCVPSTDTPRIQEAHITIGHVLCDLVETALTTTAAAGH